MGEYANTSVSIITDAEGRMIAIVNDLLFKSRRSIDWDFIEERLKVYIGQHYEIMETSEKIYIGSDFPDEFTHSKDKIRLKGGNEKAKANIADAVPKLIEIATEKKEAPDHGNKHGHDAEYGWYRYTTYFGIPVYNESGNVEKYNIYSIKMLVRRDLNGKLYLYDFIKTKKEDVQPA